MPAEPPEIVSVAAASAPQTAALARCATYALEFEPSPLSSTIVGYAELLLDPGRAAPSRRPAAADDQASA